MGESVHVSASVNFLGWQGMVLSHCYESCHKTTAKVFAEIERALLLRLIGTLNETPIDR